ncbi:histone-lysine N-methyltransferase SETD2-like [Pollicipes pollicipes]|uniref:histone-lysine N-methyltransferase SETD2-like n=1 Tax=Pollicipes pollicipes TaxID=41117 RepID=UPI001884D2AD|nr:histone-lysine N-methyltransferase SETD2-like [Pollicipes pollicipes]
MTGSKSPPMPEVSAPADSDSKSPLMRQVSAPADSDSKDSLTPQVMAPLNLESMSPLMSQASAGVDSDAKSLRGSQTTVPVDTEESKSPPLHTPAADPSSRSEDAGRKDPAVNGDGAADVKGEDPPQPAGSLDAEGKVGGSSGVGPDQGKVGGKTAALTPARPQRLKGAEARANAVKIEEKLRNYRVISDNIWLRQQKATKQQKETRRMVCDCSLSADEMERGEQGCGADCLNRLLMIECGSRCPLGERCSNKRFGRRRYCRTEVFRTELKGYGLRALQDMPAGAFIYEYVGEVLDLREFRRRRKEYSRLRYHHQYFMALRGDTIVDATERGNDSRFINHSCDPNSETQKWTVNGELRIGFFTQRPVAAGEEITFDYQLRRYGRRAQRCFCGSAQCRGWIGRKPDEQTTEEEEEEEEEEDDEENEPEAEEGNEYCPRDAGLQRRSERAKQRRDAAQRELAVEISRLVARLFLDYHGLRLIWTWMASGPSAVEPPDAEALSLRREVLLTLAVLPIPDRTALRESRVLGAVERWALASRPSTPPTPDTDTPSDNTPPETAGPPDRDAAEIAELASQLLGAWSMLQDVFRIPKKERLQRMREHEKEADRGYQTYLEQQTRASSLHAKRGYGCSPERHKRGRESPEPAERRASKYRAFSDSGLTTQERRKLFTLEVQREEEEARRQRERLAQADEPPTEPDEPADDQRRQQEQQQELWSGHEERCALLGLDPYLTPIFDASFQYYWEPSAGAWQPYTPGDPAVPLSMAAVDLLQAQQYLEKRLPSMGIMDLLRAQVSGRWVLAEA